MLGTLLNLVVRLVITIVSLAIRLALLAGMLLGQLLAFLVRAAWRAWRHRPAGSVAALAADEHRAASAPHSPPAFTPRPLRPRPRARR